MSYPIILSFDVGVINLSYCLLTKKEFTKETGEKYIDFFKKKVDVIYNDDWYQIDEAIMTMVQRENLDLFDLYYGDYQGIISNYLRPIHNIDLIERGLEKAKIFNSIAYINNISSFLEKN